MMDNGALDWKTLLPHLYNLKKDLAFLIEGDLVNRNAFLAQFV